MRKPKGTTAQGFENKNGQVVLRRTSKMGTDHNQYVYILRCKHCNKEYGTNGSDIWERKCPNSKCPSTVIIHGGSLAKRITIRSQEDLSQYRSSMEASCTKTLDHLKKLIESTDGLTCLAEMKFGKIGFDPLDAERALNLIEQINQTFTYLATFEAVEYLLQAHPDAGPFNLNLGTTAGFDIESEKKGGIVAEVFAAVTPSNNEKLQKDIKKVSGARADFKYVFFMCPGYNVGRQERYPKFPDVLVYSLGLEKR